jgi:hypothetical protein
MIVAALDIRVLSHNELFRHDPVVQGDLLTSRELITGESLFKSTLSTGIITQVLAGVWEAQPVVVVVEI